MSCDVQDGPDADELGDCAAKTWRSIHRFAGRSRSAVSLIFKAAKVDRSPVAGNQSARHHEGWPRRRRRLPCDDRRLRRLPPSRVGHRNRPRNRSSADEIGTNRLRRRAGGSARHVLFRADGDGSRAGFEGADRLSRRRRRRIDDGDGRRAKRRIHDRQLHRHERQPVGGQGLPSGADHSVAARARRLLRLRLRRGEPGAVLVGVRVGEGVLRDRHCRSLP